MVSFQNCRILMSCVMHFRWEAHVRVRIGQGLRFRSPWFLCSCVRCRPLLGPAGVQGSIQVILVSSTGNFNISMKNLKNNVFLETPDIFDNEFDLSLDGMEVVNIKPQVDPFVFPVGLSTSCHNSSMNKRRNCTFDRSSLGTELTVSAQGQTDYAGVDV